MTQILSKEEEEKRRSKRSDRGGGCHHLITGLCPSCGQVYSTAVRPVPCNVLRSVLAMLQAKFSVTLISCLLRWHSDYPVLRSTSRYMYVDSYRAYWLERTMSYIFRRMLYLSASKTMMLSLFKVATKNQVDTDGLQGPYSNTPPCSHYGCKINWYRIILCSVAVMATGS